MNITISANSFDELVGALKRLTQAGAPVAAEQMEPKAEQMEPKAEQMEPKAEQTATEYAYSMDELAAASVALIDRGFQAELVALLNDTFGVPSLAALPKDQYSAFADHLRAMGARI